jgi:hypothetical protein
MHNTKVVQNFDPLFPYQFKALMRIKNSIHAFDDEKPLSKSSIFTAFGCMLSTTPSNDFSSTIQEL